jgi:hypothetical protein
MNPSVIIVGAIVATLLGALFHLWRDGGFWRLLLYIALAWLGFFGGHFLAHRLGFEWLMLGQLHLGGGLIMGIIVLMVGHWFSLIGPQVPRTHG